MTENTCSVVMKGILKYVLSGTLLLTYSVSFVRSNWFVPVLFQFKIRAIDEKYSFILDVIVLESKMRSLFIISSSGMLLALVVEPLFTVLKCFHMLLVFFEDSTESAKYLCFAFLIRILVLFLYFLYSGHSFRRLNLSRNLRALPISGTYQAGRREDFTRLCLMGACLPKHCLITECDAAKSSSTDSWSYFKYPRQLKRSFRKQSFIKFIETTIRGVLCSGLDIFAFTFLERQTGK